MKRAASFLIFFLSLCSISLLISSVQALNCVVAKSGYWKDIQDAVDLVASTGGNVYIPEGTWNFVNVNESWTGAKVIVPPGVNIFGAPTERDVNDQVVKWKTILIMPYEAPNGAIWFQVYLDDYNYNPSRTNRFSDLRLVGWRFFNHSSTTMYIGIKLYMSQWTTYPSKGIMNFRIDHCDFQDIAGSALELGSYYAEYNRRPISGVVDHNRFVNSYGNPGVGGTPEYLNRTLGYGIAMGRANCDFWENDTSKVVGGYHNYTIFIEDNYFSKWRHVTASNDGIHYVFRHNIVEGDYGYGSVDAHGSYAIESTPYKVGTRALEVYNNIFKNPDTTWFSTPLAIQLRGGSGIIYNNTLMGYNYLIRMFNEFGMSLVPFTRVNNTYIWNNNLGSGDLILWPTTDIVENEHYFLYKPDWYTPYPYPHPLTLEEVKYYVNITGVIRDSHTGLALQGAIVSCNNTFSSETNSTGGYFISIPIPAPFSCNITVSKEGYLTNSSMVSFSNNATYVRNFYITQAIVSKITGRLIDKNNQAMEANITVYQQGSSSMVTSNRTFNGYYYLTVNPGIYDVQFNLSLNNFVKLIAVNASGDVSNAIRTISYESNKIVIEVENNYTKRIEVYSEKRPSAVKLNRSSVPSWSYDSNKRILAINLSVLLAKSGYWKDIQDAVDAVAAMGGGNVYIPEGTFNFINVGESWKTVVVPAGVSIFGAPTERDSNGQVKEWKTVLKIPWNVPTGEVFWFRIIGNSDPNKPSRFSDIKLVGYRDINPNSTYMQVGIEINSVINFRVDHCSFKHTAGGGVWTNGHYCCGVIDHCRFENDYGIPDPYDQRTVGYGVFPARVEPEYEWEDTKDVLGHYTNYTVFIEDCYFTKWRSCVDSNHGNHYVFRHNIVEHGFAHGEVDTHPAFTGGVGSRAAEIYENQFINPEPWNINWVSQLRGANSQTGEGNAGCIFNNTLRGYGLLVFLYEANDVYIWNNDLGGADLVDRTSQIQENVNYFLYKPDWYTPYQYPHPLARD